MADALRPLERRVLKLAAAGLDHSEIGKRFRRSADHIRRVAKYAQLPGRETTEPTRGLRPLERRVLHWRAKGVDYPEIASRFGRSAGHIRRVEGLAHYKISRELLAG